MLGLWQTKCSLLYFLLKDEPLQHLPAANSVLKCVMSASKNALKVGNRKLLEILGTNQVVNNTDDVNHTKLTKLLFNSLVENVNECKYFDIPMRSSSSVQNQNSLSVFHANIRSLTKNFDALYELISLPVSPDVVCVSETRIKGEPLINISIPNYNSFHKDSPTNAGGVAIYVSKKHQFKVIQEFKLNLKGCEELWIQLISNKYSTHDIIIGAIYRQPTSDSEEFSDALCNSISKINKHKKLFYLVGDFNIDMSAKQKTKSTETYTVFTR